MSRQREVVEYSLYRRMVKGCLYVVGLWPSENTKFWYRCLPYAQLVISTIVVIAIMNFMVHHIKNVTVVIKVVSLLGSTSLYILKLCLLTIYRQEILQVHQTLHGLFTDILNDTRLVEFACKKVTLCRRLGLFMTSLIYGSFFILLVILPLMNILIQEIRHYDNIKYTLVYPTMYPWNTSSDGLAYRLTYTLEALTAFSCCNVTSGADCLLLFWIFQTISQLRAMSYRINHLREQDDYGTILKQNIAEYRILINCRDQVQKIYGPIILYNNGSGAALMCTLIFQLTKASALTKIQTSRFIVYVIGKTLQVYLYSWPGTLLTTESQNYMRSIYLSDWLKHPKYTTAVLITLMQKPLTMKACHLSVVSVEMFAMVVYHRLTNF